VRRPKGGVPAEGNARGVTRLEYRDAFDPAAGPKTTLVAKERRERGH
jgi:hypothetical protein